MYTCDNCGRNYEDEKQLRQLFPNISGILERVEPGGVVPIGECPHCCALVYPANPVRLLIVLKGGLVQEILTDRDDAEDGRCSPVRRGWHRDKCCTECRDECDER